MKVISAIRYYWTTAAGYRLRPWASPYLRWRLETFFGKQGCTAGEFFALLWHERQRMNEFLKWADDRRAAQRVQANEPKK